MKKIRKRSGEDLVVLVLSQKPELKDQEIADLVGCCRTSLYRMSGFRKIRDEQAKEREAAKVALPHGSRTTNWDSHQPTTVLEAWDEGQLDPLQQLIAQEEADEGFDS